jgi:hypothetical protein
VFSGIVAELYYRLQVEDIPTRLAVAKQLAGLCPVGLLADLRKALFSEDTNLVALAAFILAEMRDKDSMLIMHDALLRYRKLVALSKTPHSSVLPSIDISLFRLMLEADDATLMSFLQSEDALVRREAAFRCGERQIHETLDTLIDALNDPYEIVVQSAAESIERIGNFKAVEPLRNVYENAKRRCQGIGDNQWNWNRFIAIGHALAHLLETEELLVWFTIGDDDDRCVVAAALAERQADSAIPFLRRALLNSSTRVFDTLNLVLSQLELNKKNVR